VNDQGADTLAGLASGRVFVFLSPMDKNTGTARKSPREERLAKALRDNLKRRKAQARDRAARPAAENEADGGQAVKAEFSP